MAQQEQLKKAINETRSFGVRLDGCKGALARAQKRLVEATTNVQLAQQQQAAASADVIKLEAEVKEIEQAVLEQNAADQKKDCLESLQSQMKKVVEEMTASGVVDGAEVGEDVKQMELLFGGLNTIKQRASARQAASAHAQPSVLQLLQRNAATDGVAIAPALAPTIMPVVNIEGASVVSMGGPMQVTAHGGG